MPTTSKKRSSSFAGTLAQPPSLPAPGRRTGGGALGEGQLDGGAARWHGRHLVVLRGRSLRHRIPMGRYLPGRGALLFLAIVAAAVWVWRNLEQEMSTTSADRAAVLTAEQLEWATGSFDFQPSSETFEKRRLLLGGFKLRYQYEGLGPDQPRMMVITRTCDSTESARDLFSRRIVSTALEWKLGPESEVGLVPLDEEQRWGNDSRVYRVEVEGEVEGYSISCRVGKRTIYAALRGIAFERDDTLRTLMEPVLETLETYDPER